VLHKQIKRIDIYITDSIYEQNRKKLGDFMKSKFEKSKVKNEKGNFNTKLDKKTLRIISKMY
jgi:hypothetical protein